MIRRRSFRNSVSWGCV